MEIIGTAVSLMVRSMVLSAQSAGQLRMLHRHQAAGVGGNVGEMARLREENRRLQAVNQLLKLRFGQASPKKRYTPMQRLQVLWHMAYYRIPRTRVKEHFLIAKSTLYRWLHAAEEGNLGRRRADRESPRKTPREIAEMIWEIFEANPHFGRKRLASILWLLGVFVAASTVRNVLLRPRPRSAPAAAKTEATLERPREIVSRYPNHVWSVDRTRVWRWGVWPTWVLVAVDHFSRRATTVCLLEGANA
ncbi:MAG: helix-turn-helix domain-containing protein, partial [Gemmatimonadota bacterium]